MQSLRVPRSSFAANRDPSARAVSGDVHIADRRKSTSPYSSAMSITKPFAYSSMSRAAALSEASVTGGQGTGDVEGSVRFKLLAEVAGIEGTVRVEVVDIAGVEGIVRLEVVAVAFPKGRGSASSSAVGVALKSSAACSAARSNCLVIAPAMRARQIVITMRLHGVLLDANPPPPIRIQQARVAGACCPAPPLLCVL